MKNKSRKEDGIKEKKTHTRVTTDCKVKKLEDGKSKADSKAKYFSDRVDDESDQLEKSDLTKELEQPSCSGSISHSPECCSQISKKRERQDSLVNGSKSESGFAFLYMTPMLRILLTFFCFSNITFDQ